MRCSRHHLHQGRGFIIFDTASQIQDFKRADYYHFEGHLAIVTADPQIDAGGSKPQIAQHHLVDEFRQARIAQTDLAARGVIEDIDWISGDTCKRITDDAAALTDFGADADSVAAICRYGQALGRELGEPDGHYEETNAAGWDVVDDLWNAAQALLAN